MPKCELCPRMLYKYDEVVANGKSYHKSCFTCGTCKKALHADSAFTEVNGFPFCDNNCQSQSPRPATGATSSSTTAVPANPSPRSNETSPRSTAAPPSTPTPSIPGVTADTSPRVTTTPGAAPARRIGGIAGQLLRKHAGDTALPPAVAAAVAHASLPAATPTKTIIPPTPTPTPVKADHSHLKPTPAKFAVISPKCACCNTSVYKAEEISAMNLYWHKTCFKCGAKGTAGGCKKVLTLDMYKELNSEPFCKNCFTKIMKDQTDAKLLSAREAKKASHLAAGGTETPPQTARSDEKPNSEKSHLQQDSARSDISEPDDFNLNSKPAETSSSSDAPLSTKEAPVEVSSTTGLESYLEQQMVLDSARSESSAADSFKSPSETEIEQSSSVSIEDTTAVRQSEPMQQPLQSTKVPPPPPPSRKTIVEEEEHDVTATVDETVVMTETTPDVGPGSEAPLAPETEVPSYDIDKNEGNTDDGYAVVETEVAQQIQTEMTPDVGPGSEVPLALEAEQPLGDNDDDDDGIEVVNEEEPASEQAVLEGVATEEEQTWASNKSELPVIEGDTC